MHRGYHVLAVPTWERKVRVLAGWLPALVFGRDIVSLQSVQHPRDAFVAAAERSTDRWTRTRSLVDRLRRVTQPTTWTLLWGTVSAACFLASC